MSVLPFAAVLAAGLMTGMTGFGFSVVSVPMLVMTYQPHEVVLIVLCLVPVTSLALLLSPHMYRRVQLRLCIALTALSLVGLPIGVLLFRRFDPTWLTVLMGIVLIAFALFNRYLPDDWRMPVSMVVPSGIVGGLLATSTGLSGPVVAMYIHGRRLAHDELVATMAGYVAAVSTLGLAIFVLEGHVTSATGWRVISLTPVALAGVALGRWWARKNHQTIERMAVQVLGLMGVLTLLRAFIA